VYLPAKQEKAARESGLFLLRLDDAHMGCDDPPAFGHTHPGLALAANAPDAFPVELEIRGTEVATIGRHDDRIGGPGQPR